MKVKLLILLVVFVLCFQQPALAQLEPFYYIPLLDTETKYIISGGECNGQTPAECSWHKTASKKGKLQNALDNNPELCAAYYGEYYPIRKYCSRAGIICNTLYEGRVPTEVVCNYTESWLGKNKAHARETREWHKQLNSKVRSENKLNND